MGRHMIVARKILKTITVFKSRKKRSKGAAMRAKPKPVMLMVKAATSATRQLRLHAVIVKEQPRKSY